MFGIDLDSLMELAKPESGSHLINLQDVLLILIWLNVRSLKNLMAQIEQNHNNRLGVLETASKDYQSRLQTLEKSRGAI